MVHERIANDPTCPDMTGNSLERDRDEEAFIPWFGRGAHLGCAQLIPQTEADRGYHIVRVPVVTDMRGEGRRRTTLSLGTGTVLIMYLAK